MFVVEFVLFWLGDATDMLAVTKRLRSVMDWEFETRKLSPPILLCLETFQQQLPSMTLQV